jgi:hypothetical protein
MFLKSTIMALALAGTALVCANAANAQDYNRNRTNAQDANRNQVNAQDNNRNQNNAQGYNRNQTNTHNRNVTVGFGNVGMGYRNGYTGNDHNWHRWEHRNDYISYRRHHHDQYHDWNHH